MIHVAKLGFRLDGRLRSMHPTVGRVALEELDRRRSTKWTAHERDLNFYLMRPLGRDQDIPYDAIFMLTSAVNRTLGRAYDLAERLLARMRSTSVDTHHIWAMMETHGNAFEVTPAITRQVLVFDAPEGNPAKTDVRVLMEYSPPPAGALNEDFEQVADWLSEMFAQARREPVLPMIPRGSSLKDVLLAHHTLTAAEASKRMGTHAEEAGTWASRKRKADELFGVWSSRARAFVHPDFQFADNVTLEQRRELFRTLRTCAGFDPMREDKGGWARAYWLYQPSAALSKQTVAARGVDMSNLAEATQRLSSLSEAARTPAEVFAEDPAAVIALAKELAAREGNRD